MFIPIGDDIQKRNFPAVGVLLIIMNVMVFMHTSKLWQESIPHDIDPRTFNYKDFDFTRTPFYKFTVKWGLVPADLARGKTIGVATYMFLHGDIIHLLGNMIVLWAFVGTLENSLGPVKFLCFYLLWGLVAGLAHAGFMWGSKLPMIGASGAVAGMIGGYFVLFGALSKIKTLIWLPRMVKVNIPAGLYVLIWLALQFAGMEQESKTGRPSVAYFAHLGGALIGAVTMVFFRAKIHSQMKVNAEGSLEFKEERRPRRERGVVLVGAVAGAPAPAGTAAAVLAPREPTNCPHCGAVLKDSHKVAQRLWRCPSFHCQRLVY